MKIEFTINTTTYESNAKGTYFYATDKSDAGLWIKRRISKAEFEAAHEQFTAEQAELIETIKAYWMATMAMTETREQMDEIWATEEGMKDLMGWYEDEKEAGLTEEDMLKEIEATPATYNDGVTADLYTVSTYYAGMTYYVVKKNGVEVYNGASVDEVIERFGFDPNVFDEIEIPRIEALIEEAEESATTEQIEEIQKEMAPKAKKERKPRKSKDIAYEGHGVTLTAKQVDFIKHLPDTCFWERGLDSCIWCDVLADEIGGQFAGKPMTTGAMLSTICEKGLGGRAKDRINGRKCTSFALTELGKLVAAELGLH